VSICGDFAKKMLNTENNCLLKRNTLLETAQGLGQIISKNEPEDHP
jgi:hypothetical protein